MSVKLNQSELAHHILNISFPHSQQRNNSVFLAKSSRASAIFGTGSSWQIYAKYEIQQVRDIQGRA